MRLVLVIAWRVLWLALFVAAFEALGYAATGSWDPLKFFGEAHSVVVVLVAILAFAILASVLIGVLDTVEDVLSVREYVRITAAARSSAGPFACTLERALELRDRERVSALAYVAAAQARSGHDRASVATLAVAAETAARVRGGAGVEALAAVAVVLAWTGQTDASRATLEAALRAARRVSSTGTLTIGMPFEQANALQELRRAA